MLLSTILANLIGLYSVDEPSRDLINDYKHEYIYSQSYKECAQKHHSVKVFGEPMQCIDDSFLTRSLEILGASSSSTSVPDLIHLQRVLEIKDGIIERVELISSKEGQILRIEATLNPVLTASEMRETAKSITKVHGSPDVTPPNHRVALWGWKSNDGYDVRLFRDDISREPKFSITHNQAYSVLRQIIE